MFYNQDLMNDETLSPVWKAAHNIPSPPSEDRLCLPQVCTALNAMIVSDHPSPKRRVSLRTSALFIGGVSRLYKSGVDDLYKDVVKLYREIIDRKGHRLYEDMEDTDGESDDDDVVTVMNESTKDSPTKQDARTAADEQPPTSS